MTEPVQMTEQRYELRCRVIAKEITYEDYQSTGKLGLVTETMVFLVPLESMQRDLFLGAWLPDTADTHHEVGLILGSPVNGPARAAIQRRNARLDYHHLFVMSVGAERDLVEFCRARKKADRVIHVTVLGEQEETRIDQMKDIELANRKKFYDKGAKEKLRFTDL